MSLTTTIPLKIGTTQVSRFVSGEGVGLAWGGTGQDLSASGGATFVLAQDASHVISARALVAADIPSLDASKITTGTIALSRLSGITTSQLSASAGITSGQIAGVALDKLTAGTLATTLALGSQAINQTGATIFTLANAGGLYLYSNVGTAGYQFYVQASDGTVRIGKTGAGNTLYNGSHSVSHFCKTNGGHYFYDNSSTLIGYFQADGSAMMGRQNVTSITTLTNYTKIHFSSTEKYRFSSALCEFDRLSLGGTIGSSVDPGAGGIAITGRLVFAGAGTASATTSQIFGYAANSHIIYNTPSTYSHSFRTANVDVFILGWSPITGYADNAFGLGQYGCGGGNSYAGIYSNGTQYLVHNATVSHQWKISGISYALQNSTGFETNRLCLGQTIGTPIDPGAGGLLLSGLIRYYSGYGASVADSTLVQTYTDGSSLLHNVNSGAYHGLRIGGYNTYTFGYSPTLASAGTNVFQLGEGSAGYILSDGWGITYNAANTYAHTLKVAGAEKFKVTSADCIAAGNFKFSTASSSIKGNNGLYIYGEGGSGGTTTTGFTAIYGSYDTSITHGASIAVYGATASGQSGCIQYRVASNAGATHYFYDKNAAEKLRIDETGVTFPTSGGSIKGTGGIYIMGDNTTLTTGFTALSGAYDYSTAHGATFAVYGNTAGAPGNIRLSCGAVAGAQVLVYDKNSATQLTIDENGTRTGTKFGMNITPVVAQTAGAYTFTGTYATDLSHIQTLYDAMRTFGFLT